MERVKRRWWTMLTFAGAGVVIAAALVSGLFQTAVYLLPAYRDDLSVWVTEVANRPVQIGGISLVWRGASPRLDLADITLYSEDGNDEVLSAQRLSLGISLWRLATGDLRPSRVELSGLNIALRVDEQGRFSLIGFDNEGEFSREAVEKWLRQLDHFRNLRLENCELTVEWPDRSALRFGLRRFDAARTLSGFSAEAELKLPDSYGDELQFETEINGDPVVPAGWSGELSAAATGLQPQPWLRGLVAPGTAAGVDSMDAGLQGRIEAGRIADLRLLFNAENLLITRAGDDQNAESVHAEVTLARVATGWRVELTQLQLEDEDQFKGRLHYLPVDGGYEVGAETELLRLSRLTPYLRYARELPADVADLVGLSGDLSDVVAQLRHAADGDHYSAQLQLDNVSLAPTHDGYGIAGLNGRLAANDSGGRLELLPGPLQLRLPILLTPELPFDYLGGTLAWTHEETGWRLAMPKFGWNLAGSGGNGQFSLQLPADAAQSPELDLSANFSVKEVAALKPWMPKHWGAALHQWLQRGVTAGRVPKGQILIHGPLRQFPFAQGGGEWKLDADVVGARVDYAPGWPVLEQLQAKLMFRGNGLSIESKSAMIAGNAVEEISSRFADFHDHLLTIDAAISGETAQFYQLLRNSPLAGRLSALLDNTRAAGPARVGLHLDIPVVKDMEIATRGTVTLDGVQLFYGSLQEPVTDIRGTLAFDGGSVTADKLEAHFADVAFEARIEPRTGTQGVIVTEFPYSMNAGGEGLSSFVPELVRKNLAGEAHFRVELPLGAEQTDLTIVSNLEGMEVRLPAPLAKAAAEASNLHVAIGGDAAAPVRIKLEYQDRLGADIALQKLAGEDATVGGASLRLGAGGPPAAATSDLHLRGQLAELDVAAWGAALQGAEMQGLPLREADLKVARWNYRGQILHDTRAVLKPVADGWDLQLEGAGAEGRVTFRKPAEQEGGGHISAQLGLLALESPMLRDADMSAETTGTAPVLDPSTWPVVDFNVGQFSFNGSNFGQLQLRSARLGAHGQKIEDLKFSGGVLDASGSGEWLREAGQSSARFKFQAGSHDFTAVLRSLGYAESLTAKQAQLKGDLAWEPAAAGLDWTQARGRIDLGFESGNLKAVEPGAGRVLGLLNFYALPRRLTLDFRDVVSAGLGFDRIAGHFDIGGGSAVTDDVSIQAPSLRMELRGRVGLAARDYDQRVTIYPDVTPGITLGAALLGGPAFAAIAFIAQQVLDKPLDQVTQLSYQVTGSWENPQVKRIEAAPKAPAVPATRPRNN